MKSKEILALPSSDHDDGRLNDELCGYWKSKWWNRRRPDKQRQRESIEGKEVNGMTERPESQYISPYRNGGNESDARTRNQLPD
jgi:hypothetical protein